MTTHRVQQTLRAEVTFKGVGLHTGKKCRATLKPAPENHGITFVRTDIKGAPQFVAHVDQVVEVVRGTTLGQGENRVYTIEHVLSALNGLEIDNAIVELDNNEPPVSDGSAKEFTEAILKAGILPQSEQQKFFTVQAPFEYQANQTVIRIEPADKFEVICHVDYNHPLLGKQEFKFERGDDYLSAVAPARTFCFDYEIEALHKNGLAKGGTLENAIVIGPTGIYNQVPLRFTNEFVRHKTLDLMGDLMLLGAPLRARVIATRCGHGHNIKFLKQLLQSQTAKSTLSVG